MIFEQTLREVSIICPKNKHISKSWKFENENSFKKMKIWNDYANNTNTHTHTHTHRYKGSNDTGCKCCD
jgi:hypothetical protein